MKLTVNDTKPCRVCRKDFVLTAAHIRHSAYICGVCSRVQVKTWRLSNPEKNSLWNRKWGVENPKKRAQSARKYRETHPEKYVVWTKKYRSVYPNKVKAHRRVFSALRSGSLIKPERCERCDSVSILEGHHTDYSKPLTVIWLCKSCHNNYHREAV